MPLKLPINNSLRRESSIDEFALEFYVSADVCWSKLDGESSGKQVVRLLSDKTPGFAGGLGEFDSSVDR